MYKKQIKKKMWPVPYWVYRVKIDGSIIKKKYGNDGTEWEKDRKSGDGI